MNYFTNAYMLISENCNMNCSYCFYGKTLNKNNVLIRNKEQTMSKKTIERTIDFLAENALKNNKNFTITFFGGEPTLAIDKIKYSIEYARKKVDTLNLKDPRFSIITNGKIFSEKIAEYLTYENFEMQISFDGIIQNETRGENTFEVVYKNLLKYREYLELREINTNKISIHSVFTPDHIDKYYENFLFFYNLGIYPWFLPTFEGEWTHEKINIYREQLNLVKEFIKNKILSEFSFNSIKLFSTMFRIYKTEAIDSKTYSCGVGNNMISVDSNGFVLPCHRYKTNRDNFPYYGNIFDHFDELNKKIELKKDDFSVPKFEMEGLYKCSECPANGSCYACVSAFKQINDDIRKPVIGFCKLMLNHYVIANELIELIYEVGLDRYLTKNELNNEKKILKKIKQKNIQRDIKLTEILEKKFENIQRKL